MKNIIKRFIGFILFLIIYILMIIPLCFMFIILGLDKTVSINDNILQYPISLIES